MLDSPLPHVYLCFNAVTVHAGLHQPHWSYSHSISALPLVIFIDFPPPYSELLDISNWTELLFFIHQYDVEYEWIREAIYSAAGADVGTERFIH